MQRSRKIAATPIRSATATWAAVSTLLVDTLERSSDITPGSVATALHPLNVLAPALVASGGGTLFTLIAGDLYLDVDIVKGDDAVTLEENLAPVPGGAAAPSTWLLHIRPPAQLTDLVTAAVDGSKHLILGEPASSKATTPSASGPGSACRSEARTPAGAVALTIDAAALRRLGGSQ